MAQFYQGDLVKYVGNKYRQDLGTRIGVVVAPVRNQEGLVVVDYGDAYILSEVSLRKLAPPKDGEELEYSRKHHRHDEGVIADMTKD